MIKKIRNFKFVIRNCQKGMTYVELIVVLSIFAVMSSVVLFNYKEYQARVEIKKLTSDIALQIVEAQKNAMSGKLLGFSFTNGAQAGRPSYGIYFNTTSGNQFIVFADLNNDHAYTGSVSIDEDNPSCSLSGSEECLDVIKINKATYSFTQEDMGNNLNITFTRPDSGAKFYDNTPAEISVNENEVDIKITSTLADGPSGTIKIHSSGRIEITN